VREAEKRNILGDPVADVVASPYGYDDEFLDGINADEAGDPRCWATVAM